MNVEDTSLEHHLIETKASEKLWVDFLALAKPKANVWLKGKQPALLELVGTTHVHPAVIKSLTETFGPKIWTEALNGKIPAKELISTHIRVWWVENKTTSKAIREIARHLPAGQLHEYLNEAIAQDKSEPHSKTGVNKSIWCGKPREYWNGHALEIPAKLVHLGLGEVALSMEMPQWEKVQPDGTNLAYLFMHDEKSWLTWCQERSPHSPVYLDCDNTRLEQGKRMYEWMADNGLIFEGVAKLGKAEGKDIAFEQQLRGKSWRSAIARRENWRTWTGSANKNAMHIVARYHPVSFLTSQARVESNKDLFGAVDNNGDDCINHLVVGLLSNIPEKNGSFWKNAIARIHDTLDMIQRQVEEQGNASRARGIMAALLTSPISPDRFPNNYREMLSPQLFDFLHENPGKLWAGMDRQCAEKMIQNFAHTKRCSPFTNYMLSLICDKGREKEFMECSAEARMILLMMALSRSKGERRYLYLESAQSRIKNLFEQTMSEKIELSEMSMKVLDNIVRNYEKTINVDTSHLDAISKKITQIKLMKVAGIKLTGETEKRKIKM